MVKIDLNEYTEVTRDEFDFLYNLKQQLTKLK